MPQESNDSAYPRLRAATFGELPAIARILSLAFWDDALCGQRIHPHREAYPADVDLYWLRRARVHFWDRRWRWVVAVDRDPAGGPGEVIAGIAQWSRFGDGGRPLELAWFDPRTSSCLLGLCGWVNGWVDGGGLPPLWKKEHLTLPHFRGSTVGRREHGSRTGAERTNLS